LVNGEMRRTGMKEGGARHLNRKDDVAETELGREDHKDGAGT
jgi:hypothetical protein